MPAPIITLTTDFGTADGFPAAMKAEILRRAPGAQVIDVTHDAPPQAIAHASFVLGSVAGRFPAGTVHCAVVDPGVGTGRAAVVLTGPGGIRLVGPDNGVFTHAMSEGGVSPDATPAHPFLVTYEAVVPEGWSVFHLDVDSVSDGELSRTFHGRDVFAPAAALLAGGASPSDLGDPAELVTLLNLPGPQRIDEGLAGHVQYVDRFGNLATDLRPAHVASESFELSAGGATIAGLSGSYSAAGGLGCVIASHGFLEIFLTQGNAARLLGLSVGDEVTLRMPAA